MNPRITLSALITAFVVAAPAISAQTKSGLTSGVRLETEVRRLGNGTTVRVRQSDTIVTEGKLLDIASGNFRLTGSGTAGDAISYGDVNAMWKRGSSAGKGALIGAGFGAGILGSLGLLAGSGLCEVDDCSQDTMMLGLVGAALGALGGGAAGAVIGSVVKRWVRVYP